MDHLLRLIFGIQIAFAQAAGAEKVAAEPGIFEFIVLKLPLWISAAVIFIIFIAIAFIVKGSVESRLASKIEEEHQEVMIISGRLSFVAVITIGATIALSVAGIDLTVMLAGLAFGISFGLQDTIANFVAGLGILAARPFKIGDWILVNGKFGKVVEIRTRATYLKTADGLRLIVPNAELYKSAVLSYTSNPMRRIKVPVYCRYGIRLEDVTRICLKVLKTKKQILLEPKPYVLVVDMADYYIELQVRFWIMTGTAWLKLRSKVFAQIHQLLEEAGLDAPYPVTSLSTEEDIETGAFKARVMDKDEVKEMISEREKYQQELDLKKEEILAEAPVAVVKTGVDQAGVTFLKTPEQPAVQAQQQVAQVQQTEPAGQVPPLQQADQPPVASAPVPIAQTSQPAPAPAVPSAPVQEAVPAGEQPVAPAASGTQPAATEAIEPSPLPAQNPV